MGHTAESGDTPTAFELMSHETRINILRELSIRQRNRLRDPLLSFTELRKRVGHRDSGNFNYHLDQLVGQLVVKESEGYRLSYAGLKMVGAMATSRYDRSNKEELPTVDAACRICGEAATASYERGVFHLECTAGHTFDVDVPKAPIERRTGTDLLEFVSCVTQQKMELAVQDVCPLCHGHLPSGIEIADEAEHTYQFQGTCEYCGAHVCNTVGSCLVRHPAVVAFLYEHDTNVRSEPYRALDMETTETTVQSESPLRLRIVIQRGNEVLRLTLADDATVVDVERTTKNEE